MAVRIQVSSQMTKNEELAQLLAHLSTKVDPTEHTVTYTPIAGNLTFMLKLLEKHEVPYELEYLDGSSG